MKRLTWRTLRDTSDRPFLARSSSSSTIMGKKMSCSAKRNSAVGSCMSTLVSRMYRRGRSAMGGAPGNVLGRSGQLAHGLEHVFDVAGHAHLAPFAHQPAVFVEQKGAAFYAAHLAVEHVLVLHDAELVAQGFVAVGNESDRKVVLFGKALVAFERIARHAGNAAVQLGKLIMQVAKVLALGGAAGRVVARVEVKHQRLAGKIFEPDRAFSCGFKFGRSRLEVCVGRLCVKVLFRSAFKGGCRPEWPE